MPKLISDETLFFLVCTGYMSYRDPDSGSHFIQCLVPVFAKHCHNMSVQQLLTIVSSFITRLLTETWTLYLRMLTVG